MIWLDFFLQVFVHALAWCLATAGVAAVWIAVAVAILNRSCPKTRQRRRRW